MRNEQAEPSTESPTIRLPHARPPGSLPRLLAEHNALRSTWHASAFGCLWDDGLVVDVFALARLVGDWAMTDRGAWSDDMDAQAQLAAEVRAIWDAKAAFWDERMGEGNAFQLELIGPAVERLLAMRPGERILDVGCGNGVTSRRLAHLGARVVAIDTSSRFLELARSRSPELSDRIDYRLIDATDEEQLLTLGEGRFDALVCNMVLMDMPVIDRLLRASRRLLAPDGRFVFAVQHPAFNSNAMRLCAETEARGDGLEVTRHAVKVTDYLLVPAGKGTGMPGEPEPH